MKLRVKQAKGFTLLELLVAIAVFAVLAMMSYGTLSNLLQQRNQLAQSADELNRIQKAMLHLERDLLQMVVRPILDENGFERGAVVGEDFEPYKLEFTRTGRPNPNLSPRSYLQRVAYVINSDEEEKLYRYVWPSLDRADTAEPQKLLLLDDVEELKIIFYDNQGEEHNQWPSIALQTAGQPTLRVIPRAIKVILKLKSMGEVWRLYDVPGAQSI